MAELPHKSLIAIEDSGMADRVQLMLNGYRMAQENDRPFVFIWEPGSFCGARFEDLFINRGDFTILDKDPCPGNVIADFRATYWPLVRMFIRAMYRTCLDDLSVKLHAYPQWHDPADFGETGVIDFAPAIKSRAAEIAGQLRGAIGVHIRATDYANRMPPLADYKAIIHRFARDRKVFIASDNGTYKRELARELGERAIMCNEFMFARDDRESTIQGAIDLYLLRCCETLIYSGYSGFSRLAIRNEKVPLLVPKTIGENPHANLGCVESNGPKDIKL